MRLRFTLTLLALASLVLAKADALFAQATNIRVTNPNARAILAGDFDVADYPGGEALDVVDELAPALLDQLSADSLKALLLELNTFGNRNTGADTTSATTGMGAARTWGHDRMLDYAARTGNRLQVGYVAFDQDVCGMAAHRNVLGVLPGTGPRASEVILVEGHIDSRCAGRCDIDCDADGMEDNASGTALVLELARVMSAYRFDRTLAFMLTTGEEQGLIGAAAFADYCVANDVAVDAVLNNDVIGGVICGQTASPPMCPGLNDIDSINVRIFSSTSVRNLARYTKRAYEARVAPLQAAPSVIQIQNQEDRTGRGGDHIPFREAGFNAIRFTSANEHGDAGVDDPDYSDRQHTEEDVLGLDTDMDGELDSFFVDFRYLRRNAIINGATAALLADAPTAPERITGEVIDFRTAIEIDDPLGRDSFLLAVRNAGLQTWDTLYTVSRVDTIVLPVGRWSLSAAYVGDRGLESQFTPETRLLRVRVSSTGELDATADDAVELLPNYPNPFDEATTLRVFVNDATLATRRGELVVSDVRGRVLSRLPVSLTPGMHEVAYAFSANGYQRGTFTYALLIDGRPVASRQMIYAY